MARASSVSSLTSAPPASATARGAKKAEEDKRKGGGDRQQRAYRRAQVAAANPSYVTTSDIKLTRPSSSSTAFTASPSQVRASAA